ncbi:MAG: hypothetical protein DMG35_08120 [Acidobacteria bacterium]|nr:MAG: hypothetical protein DMG35_08120 [Acidobacteriota bacterium]
MTLISIFLIILITTFAVVAFFTEPSKTDKLIHSRLVSLDRKRVSSGDDEPGIVREVAFSTIPAFDKFLRSNRFAIGLQLLIEQCDLQWTVGRVVFSTLLIICLGEKRKLRLRRFSELLPEAIDLMSRGMRAGQALPATVETVAQESDDPLRSEFRRAADEQSFGLPFRESMVNLSRRVPLADLQFLVTAILVQKETGGNLAQILDKTSHVIRERVRVSGQMRIRTAQGRLTGWILCGLPFAMFIAMNFVHPGYGRVLFEDPLGQKMVAYAAVLMVIGVLVIRRIVDVKF